MTVTKDELERLKALNRAGKLTWGGFDVPSLITTIEQERVLLKRWHEETAGTGSIAYREVFEDTDTHLREAGVIE